MAHNYIIPDHDVELLARGWDAAVAQLVYADGSPVEVETSVNPYREELERRAKERAHG